MWQEMVNKLVYEVWGLNGALANALDFFIYDTVKIFVLLLVIIFGVSFLRTWFDTERVRDYLAGKPLLFGHVLAALFGIVTPFCTCSAIPLFLGFLQARIPVGVTFSYLISAPMNNEVAIAMLFTLFGWKITVLYIGFGLLVAVMGGVLIGKMNPQRWILIDVKPAKILHERVSKPIKQRFLEAQETTVDIIKKIWLYVMAGVGIGAWIHGYVPADTIAHYAGGDSWWAVPLAVIMGVPMYSNAAGVMPLVEVLTNKGVLLGTALSFMMAVTALSLPEAMILKRILHTKLIALFFGIVALGIILIGYLFNILLKGMA